jgi:cytochrome P450
MTSPTLSESRVPSSGHLPRRLPPRAKGLPLVGVSAQILRDPFGSFQQFARERGDIVELPVPGMKFVLVSHPDYVKHITNTNHATYPKPNLFSDIWFREPPRFHGMANGAEWRRVRRMLNPKFSARGLAPLAEQMIDAVVDTVDQWDSFAGHNQQIDIQEHLSLVTMTVLLRSMFSRPAPMDEIERLAKSYIELTRGMTIAMATTPIPYWVPRPFERRYNRAKAEIAAYVDRMVAERRRNPNTGTDLLNMILDAEFEDGSKMDDEHIRRELMGLIFGGYETTAAVMSWVLARLPLAPDVQERAYAEVDALGGRRVTPDDVEALPWLRACFDECQRLQGFPLNAREATEDDEIGGHYIPAGTVVGFSGQTLHRDPRWWREPERFLPERFLDDDINTYAFLPFGVGPRRCLGTRMAYMVGMWTLATAFQRYRFELPPGWSPQARFSFSTTVKGGVPVRLRPR